MKKLCSIIKNIALVTLFIMVSTFYANAASDLSPERVRKEDGRRAEMGAPMSTATSTANLSATTTTAVHAPALTPFQIDSLELRKYPYIDATYDKGVLPPFAIEEYYKRAGTVIFTVNKTDIKPGNPFINQLRQEIAPLIKSQNLELYRIDVRGAASPEGPTENNERLARGRANILRDSITSILPSATGDIVHLSSVTEDYELLLHLMEKAGDRDFDTVRSIYAKWKHSTKDLKWALYNYGKHTLWKRLLQEYFPQLRATRVILYFHIAPEPEPEPEPNCQCGPDCPMCDGKCIDCHCADKLPVSNCQCGPDCPMCDGKCIDCHCCHIPEPPVPVVDTLVHRRPVLALSTNLVYDLWYMPGFGFAPMWNGKLEYYPYSEKHPLWNHMSFAAGFTNPYWHKWDEHKFYQIRNYELEARWYSRFDDTWGQRYGWYVGAAIDNNIYGIGLSDTRGWQGEGLGGQITGGYVLPISKCKAWKLEFNLGVGFYQSFYDPYVYEDPFKDGHGGHGEYDPPTFNPSDEIHYYYKWYGAARDFKERQHRFRWFGPTQIGISLKYDLLWKCKDRRGASFRHIGKEVSHE